MISSRSIKLVLFLAFFILGACKGGDTAPASARLVEDPDEPVSKGQCEGHPAVGQWQGMADGALEVLTIKES